jgi:hypothetical protein
MTTASALELPPGSAAAADPDTGAAADAIAVPMSERRASRGPGAPYVTITGPTGLKRVVRADGLPLGTAAARPSTPRDAWANTRLLRHGHARSRPPSPRPPWRPGGEPHIQPGASAHAGATRALASRSRARAAGVGQSVWPVS